MDTAVIKKEAIDGYAAFGAMDAEGAMRDISDDVEWVVSGNSSLTGTYHGKDEVGTLWMKFLEKGFRTTPTEFLADGDKVVVMTETSLDGEQARTVDVLSYDEEGKLIRFESFGGEAQLDHAFPR